VARQWAIHERIPAKSLAVPHFACAARQKYYKKRVMQAKFKFAAILVPLHTNAVRWKFKGRIESTS
jgi:hypothetical protein